MGAGQSPSAPHIPRVAKPKPQAEERDANQCC